MNVKRHSWLLGAIKTRFSVPSISVHLHIENTTLLRPPYAGLVIGFFINRYEFGDAV